MANLLLAGYEVTLAADTNLDDLRSQLISAADDQQVVKLLVTDDGGPSFQIVVNPFALGWWAVRE